LGDEDLVAIIQRAGTRMVERDPYIVVRDMRVAMKGRWGKDWSSKSYIGKKSRIADKIDILREADVWEWGPRDGLCYYATAVTWYGDESVPQLIPIKDPPSGKL
jgi:hypothetical protein